ncbi:MAG: DUF4349 domain-containing protein [Solirubrobacterales bacterium]
METPRDDQLAADLRALRPAPHPDFATELDKRAAAGFPRRSRLPRFSPVSLRLPKARRLLPAAAVAILAIAVAGAVITNSGGDGSSSSGGGMLSYTGGDSGAAPEPIEESASEAAPSAAAEATESSSGLSYDGGGRYVEGKAGLDNRAVERNAELVLGADPADVADDSAHVFEAVHAHDGIVLRSSTREGEPGVAGARFELLIPSGKLGDALAALSAIDEVRTRHEATNDITAPTATTGELLRDSKARVDSLLAQLEGAETESEREAVEAELAQERRHRARLRAQLQHLERRADFSRVLLRIETGDSEQSTDEGAWGVADALDDAGQILAVAVAVAVVALAILGPIALIALLAWLAHRAWLRRERRRVLS